jgi:preprotein translocase subunit YajC
MNEHSFLLAIGSTAADTHPLFGGMLPMVLIFLIFYFVLILPMRNKQKKAESMVSALKPGDRVLINPGIFGTVVSLEENALFVRVDDKTKIRVLKSAVAERLEDPTSPVEKK